MEYGKPDSSGTDDDLPVQKVNRFSRGIMRMTENMRAPAASMPHGGASPDMEEQIHNLEMEAYNAVLKAFIAQSDDLSWGKEKLISQLRHELKVSEVEHIESLATVDSDDLVRHIREWRKGTKGSHELLPNVTYASGLVPGPTLVNAHKKLKMAHFTASPNCLPRVQSSSMLPSASPNYMSHLQPSAGLQPGRLRDKQWSEGALVNEGNVGQSVKSMGHTREVAVTGKGRGSLKVHPGKHYAPSMGDGLKKVPDRIEIRETHVIIHEVERVCGVENPNPALLEKAKLILKEHEKSLLEAIAKLESMADLGFADWVGALLNVPCVTAEDMIGQEALDVRTSLIFPSRCENLSIDGSHTIGRVFHV
ncbi:protein EMSY-LIKE 3-like isoform X2 [Nymphaea colorata]|uniref:protein EMSY-LIKE 3-like isoform X2 n=1 Tax=Nymphaea colorata TaxID=210225 RepID=UPI00129D3D65|nr:protein EMSY-LIKE 3-like isoform X2 [Nymphaea colorata]